LDAGVLPRVHRDFPNVAITGNRTHYDEPDLYDFVKTIVGPRTAFPTDPGSVATKLRNEYGCKGWRRKSGLERGLEFPPLGQLRDMFEAKYGKQSWSFPDQQHWSDKSPKADLKVVGKGEAF